LTGASVCNGQGACTAATSTSCASANYCTGGSCIPKLGNGTSCATNTECSSANCSNSTCCASGLTGCSGTCYDLATNTANCGTCGHVCPAPPVVGSGSATCSGGTCGLTCSAGYLQCGGTSYCQIATWNFDDGTADGFAVVGNSQPAVTSVMPSAAVTHGSSAGALAITVNIQGSDRSFEVGLKLCGGSGFLPAGTHVVSAWFYLQPSDASTPPGPNSTFGEHLYTNSSEGGNAPTNATVGAWFQVSSTISDVGNQLTAFSLQGSFDPATDWSGTVYVDDVMIQ
jgi:hypothetical protein